MDEKHTELQNLETGIIPAVGQPDSIPNLANDIITAGDAAEVLDKSKQLLESMLDYKELIMMYTCALKEVRTKFEVLNTEFNVRYSRNPINFINTRIKSTASILEKLGRKKLAFNIENIESCINDIAGIRVICSYVDDIYFIAEALTGQDDIKLLQLKDYIKTPKPNGYRSLHMIVSVPVFFAEQTREMKVEVQIRTIAMDFWASLEHQLKYKKSIKEEELIVEELSKCADTIAKTDSKMLEIRRLIENDGDTRKQPNLYEKLRKIDIAVE